MVTLMLLLGAVRSFGPISSPRNVTFVRSIFSDPEWGFRDPTAPVFDGQHWHVWATKVRGTEPGYGAVVWHLFSETLDANWQDGGIALNTSAPPAWDSHGVFTPSVAWEGAGGAVVAAPNATAWYLFFGGVAHPQPVYDESIGVASAASPFGPWTKFNRHNPIISAVINGSSPPVPWCDSDGPGPTPGVLHVDEAEPYVLRGQRRLYVKTVCRNHTVLPSIFRPTDLSSWKPPYQYDSDIQQPIIPPAVTPSGRGFEQSRVFMAPDGRLHMTATAYDGFQPHFVSTDHNTGVEWELVEKISNWGASPHELTPVHPAAAEGGVGGSGVPQYFIQFGESPYRLDLLKVHWENCSL